MATKEQAKRPIRKIRINGITASIWANETENGIRNSVTFDRSYKDDKGKWQQTTSFGYNHLPTLAKVVNLAFDAIHYTAGSQDEEGPDETK